MEAEIKHIFAPVIIRRSAVFLFFKLLVLELLVVVIFITFRIPVHLLQEGELVLDYNDIFNTYTIIFVVLSFFKLTVLLAIILMWMNDYYEVLPGELIHKRGIFHTKSTTFSLSNIELQDVDQGIIAKIFNYGTIEIFNPLLKQTFWLVNVPYPHKQLKAIQHQSHQSNQDTKIIPLPS
jgi:uncharacterized membrane protein YdbT with pleckstrin-like domain